MKANGSHLLCAGTARMTIEKALNMKVMSMMTLPWGSGCEASTAASKKMGVVL